MKLVPRTTLIGAEITQVRLLMHMMKLPLTLAFALMIAARVQSQPIRVMTFNIRFATAPDGDNIWPLRRELLLKVIRDFDPDVLGVQEAQRIQVDQLANAFPEYNHVGVGREPDGGGEYSAIFFRRERFDLCDAATQWLSDTPLEAGSRSWGNNLPRIYTLARLLDRRTQRRFIVMNTHWDHESQPARLHSGKMMAEHLAEAHLGFHEPTVVMGDFNAAPDNPAIGALTKGGKLTDTLLAARPEEKELSTFNGFGAAQTSPKIDAIFVDDGWKVEDAAIVRTNDNGRFPSDHFPVTATVTLKSEQK